MSFNKPHVASPVVQLPAAEDHPTARVLPLHPGFALPSECVLHGPLHTPLRMQDRRFPHPKPKWDVRDLDCFTHRSSFAEAASPTPWWRCLVPSRTSVPNHPTLDFSSSHPMPLAADGRLPAHQRESSWAGARLWGSHCLF